MASLEDFKVIFNSLDTTQLTIIIALTGLVLVLLILLAVKRGGRKEQVAFPNEERIQRRSKPESAIGLSQTVIGGRAEAEESKPTVQKQVMGKNRPPELIKTEVLSQPAIQTKETPQIPEDSVLRRHYFANQAAEALALHEPYPTDSVLRRHYDVAHKIAVERKVDSKASAESETVSEAQASIQAAAAKIPEDSVLRRHYFANLAAEALALHEPYPTDSVLRRHYDVAHKIAVERKVGSKASAESETVSEPQAPIQAAAAKIPEDSVLRRHFLADEAAKTAALHEPYPTDSVLRRHYDASHKIVVETAAKIVKSVVGGSNSNAQKASIIELAVDKAAPISGSH
ncbi:hypothetical protein [Methylomonas sp. MgM2]